MAMYIVKPWYRKKDDAIYGAEWAGTSDPSWVRTDAAVGFSAPNPYYSGMSTTPSSPFDNIMPWSGMRRVTDANAGELVEIPKFYYKWTRDGVKMKLQISMTKFDGFLTSPAHADRGDGVGERDYVYVGRYHCASDYKSKTGVTPKASATRATFRSGIHALGLNVWQNDYATRVTMWLLYLVEYANWNSQTIVGYGGGNNNSIGNMGYTDSMSYHTGTTQASRTTYGLGTQYRYIEGLWDNVYDFVDGIVFSSSNVYVTSNPNNFGDITTNHTLVGTRSASNGYISAWNVYNNPNEPWAIYPSSVSGSNTTYVCDYYYYFSDGVALYAGGGYNQSQNNGLFYLGGDGPDSNISDKIGSRLMVLPPSRLSA